MFIRALRVIVASLVSTLLVCVAAISPAPAAPLLVVGYTYTDISCHGLPYPNVKLKSWGTSGPKSKRIHIDQTIKIDGQQWRTQDDYVNSTSTGSWSGPTHSFTTFLTGTYTVYTYVYVYANGADSTYVGSDTDSCKM